MEDCLYFFLKFKSDLFGSRSVSNPFLLIRIRIRILEKHTDSYGYGFGYGYGWATLLRWRQYVQYAFPFSLLPVTWGWVTRTTTTKKRGVLYLSAFRDNFLNMTDKYFGQIDHVNLRFAYSSWDTSAMIKIVLPTFLLGLNVSRLFCCCYFCNTFAFKLCAEKYLKA